MLFPKKVKHRKWQTGRHNPNKKRIATRGTSISFGSFALKATSSGRITSNQIEASRRVLRRTIDKGGSVWVRIFPDMPYTRKPAEVGMGKGKGDVAGFQVAVFPGRVLFEVDGVPEDVAKEALRKAGAKLPIKVKIASRE